MYKTLFATAALGTLLIAGPAFASDLILSTGGIVKKVDRAAGKITLESGLTYHDYDHADLRSVRSGDKVTIMYDDGSNVLSLHRQ